MYVPRHSFIRPSSEEYPVGMLGNEWLLCFRPRKVTHLYLCLRHLARLFFFSRWRGLWNYSPSQIGKCLTPWTLWMIRCLQDIKTTSDCHFAHIGTTPRAYGTMKIIFLVQLRFNHDFWWMPNLPTVTTTYTNDAVVWCFIYIKQPSWSWCLSHPSGLHPFRSTTNRLNLKHFTSPLVKESINQLIDF